MLHIPKLFSEDRPEVLAALIKDVTFGALVTPTPDGLRISHVPMLLKHAGGPVESWVLECHVARPNPHARASGQTVAMFQGPHGYISPAWYPSKAEHGKVVPTWNYAIVHVHGTLTAFDDEAQLRAHLEELTAANEGARAEPWRVSDAPADYVQGQLKAIVGLRLSVTRAEGKWKMSQNRTAADKDGARRGRAAEHGERDGVAILIGDFAKD